jgi:DNA polymerase-1
VSVPKIYLVDGTSMIYRAYYAIPSLTNSKGEATNAIYGFITMMRKLIEDTKPDFFAICFDRREPTFRHKKFEDYKAHRKPMPEDLVDQLEPIKNFCKLYGLAVFEEAGYEADDLLGTLAVKGREKGYEVFVVTGDKDAMQLVDEKIKMLNPYKENLVYGPEEVRKRFDGLGPEKVVDVMALMGDASDNIPGVRGIGEKTAVKLIREFGSVENLIKYVSKIKSKSQQALVREGSDSAILSKELATIDTAMPIEIVWDKLKIHAPDEVQLSDFCKRYEFKNLLKEFAPSGATASEDRHYHVIQDEAGLRKLVARLSKVAEFSFDTETTSVDPMRAHLVGLSFSCEPLEAYYVPVSSEHHQGPGLKDSKVLEILKPTLEHDNLQKSGQNIKYDWIVMKRHGITVRGVAFDTMVASYLANPLKRNHNLDDIAVDYLGIRKITTESLIGSGKKQISMAEVPLESIANYAAEDADCVYRLKPILSEKMEEAGLGKLFRDVEMPLCLVLARMEMNGVNLDTDFLKGLSAQAGKDLDKLTNEIYALAGREFNINSTKQLAEVLFVDLKLPQIKKTKTGFSTDVSVLEKLAVTHELPRKLLEYREKTKLKSTYLDALPEILNPETHLIHTSYNQTTTATGRLSSSDPNLQNIPIKTEAGRMIRKAFIPRKDAGKGRLILSADYSQIELRVLAHLTADKNLRKAFAEDRDVHRYTATLLYGVSEEDVTREMRNAAKTINFSIIYGKTAYGLSQDLGISVSEADEFIGHYFKRYHAVKDYLEAQKEKARQDGYLTTILGRRSYFPDIHSKNVQLRQFAERAAINAPIQGSAADIIKLAMIRIQDRLDKERYETLMTMQVHDELVFDVPASEREKATLLVRKEMEGAYALEVPLRVDVFTGDTWYKD